MSAMHHDTTPDLKVVATKLKDILEVHILMIFTYYLTRLKLLDCILA